MKQQTVLLAWSTKRKMKHLSGSLQVLQCSDLPFLHCSPLGFVPQMLSTEYISNNLCTEVLSEHQLLWLISWNLLQFLHYLLLLLQEQSVEG